MWAIQTFHNLLYLAPVVVRSEGLGVISCEYIITGDDVGGGVTWYGEEVEPEEVSDGESKV